MSKEVIAAAATGVKRKSWRRHGEQAWRAMIEGQRRSGMNIEAFCAREGVSRSSFGRWRRLLAARAGGTPNEIVAAGESSTFDTRRSGFIDAGVLHASATNEPVEIRLELGGGLVVTIRRG
jgi:transposase-like protein